MYNYLVSGTVSLEKARYDMNDFEKRIVRRRDDA